MLRLVGGFAVQCGVSVRCLLHGIVLYVRINRVSCAVNTRLRMVGEIAVMIEK